MVWIFQTQKEFIIPKYSCPFPTVPMYPLTLTILLLLLGSVWTFIHILLRPKNERKLPPGPWALPIIGNLHMLGDLPHRALQSLAKTYGPIMSLRLGHVPTIVVSSPQAAELFLKTHDTIFASRPKLQFAKYIAYGNTGLVFTKYGPDWRNVRKICTLQLLTASKIESFAPMRKKEVGSLVQSLKNAAAAHEVVDLSRKVCELIEETSCRMIFGRSRDDRFDLKAIIEETFRLAGAFNLADYVPYLGALDLQVCICFYLLNFVLHLEIPAIDLLLVVSKKEKSVLLTFLLGFTFQVNFCGHLKI